MSQSEKLNSILEKVKANAKGRAAMKPVAIADQQDTSKVGDIDPSVLLVRGCRDDILAGKFDPKSHPLWEMKLIN